MIDAIMSCAFAVDNEGPHVLILMRSGKIYRVDTNMETRFSIKLVGSQSTAT